MNKGLAQVLMEKGGGRNDSSLGVPHARDPALERLALDQACAALACASIICHNEFMLSVVNAFVP